MLRTQVRQRSDVVDGSGIRGPCGRDHAERKVPGFLVGNDHRFELADVYLHALIHRDAPQRLAPQAKQPGRFIQRMVRLSRRIEHRLPADRRHAIVDRMRKARGERQRKRAEIRFIAARCERAVERSRVRILRAVPPDALADPPHRLVLDLRRQLRTRQRRQLGIQRRDQRLGQHGNIRGRGIH